MAAFSLTGAVILSLTFMDLTKGSPADAKFRRKRQIPVVPPTPPSTNIDLIVPLAQTCPSTTSFCRDCVCTAGATGVANAAACETLGCCSNLLVEAPTCPNAVSGPLTGTTPTGTRYTVGCCPFSECTPGYYCAYSVVNTAWMCCSASAQPPITNPTPLPTPIPSTRCPDGSLSPGPCIGGSLCQVGLQCITPAFGQPICCPAGNTGTTPPPFTFTNPTPTQARDPYGCPSGNAVIYQYTLPRQLPLICNKPTAEGRQGFCPNGSVCLRSVNPAYSWICCRGATALSGVTTQPYNPFVTTLSPFG